MVPQPRNKRITVIPQENIQFIPCFFFTSAISQQHNHIFHERIVSVVAHELFELIHHSIPQLGDSFFAEINPICSILNSINACHRLSLSLSIKPVSPLVIRSLEDGGEA
uniref:Uncharacterized protein n=1 Tax=Rhizophora mucronata TaxID=61149 RepID=A0A2P2LCE6_RHIMU